MFTNLRAFTREFVLCRLSLFRIWQGYLVTEFCTSLGRCNSTTLHRSFFRSTNNQPRSRKTLSFSAVRKFHKTANMGSSFSRGRKYSPTKNLPDTNPTALLEHAKFSCGDAPEKKTQYIEEVVCNESDIPENGMKVVDLGGENGGKVLLVKQKGVISALGTKCTHYGAPLVNGHLGDGRIRCQWHGACFNICNGDIEDFPGLDSLPCYEVKISSGAVSVRADLEVLRANKRVKPFISTVRPTRATFIVVGGGAAGNNCVETLRQEGFDGRIVFVLGENYLPYDRIKLSKSLDVDPKNIILRSMLFYQERNIEIMLNTHLSSLDAYKKTATFTNGQVLQYDKIFLATGSTPRRLNVPGCNLQNIFELRTIEDAKKIMSALKTNSNVVVLGTSFIGMEAAGYLVDKVKSVVVVGKNIPFNASFGPVIGNRILKLYQEKGVEFRLGSTVQKFEGSNSELSAVVLNDGTVLPADICLVGIGVVSNTSYLNSSGIETCENGTVEVNEYLQTKFHDVYAGGDIAMAPVLGNKASIGHWGLANYHGHIAALNMMGKQKALRTIPFFWTVLLGKGFRYTGYAKTFDDVVIDGDLEQFKFIAFYCNGNNVVAVTTINKDPVAAKFAELLYEGKTLKKNEIEGWLS